MTKKSLLLPVLFLAIVAAAPVYGQGFGGGCGDSPENPTVILAGMAAGAFAISSVRTRLRARRGPKAPRE